MTEPVVDAGDAITTNETPASTFRFESPTVVYLEPNYAHVGGPDVTLEVHGAGFNASSVIVWNRGDEPTTLVDGETLTTGVKPSTASGPRILPVNVRTTLGDGWVVESNTVEFAFLP